jgi:hypothetical protein
MSTIIAPKPPIVDVRGLVARQPGAQWGKRSLTDIKGVVYHQELGPGDVYSVARYHTSKDCHVSPGKGCPSICYTFFVDTSGTIQWCNELEDITWSQAGEGQVPILGTKANTNFLAVCFRGDFTGPGHAGASEPTQAQLDAAGNLWRWLRDMLHLRHDALYGHCDFGKPACPGDTIMATVQKLIQEPLDLAEVTPSMVEQWQQAFVTLGYDIGTSGPAGNGVDGEWGPVSQKALLAFQAAVGIPRSASRDDRTAAKVAELLLAKAAAAPPPAPRARRPKASK